MDLHPSHGQALPCVRLPAGIIHYFSESVEDTDLMESFFGSPESPPPVVEPGIRKKRKQFPYKSQRKSG